MVHWPVPVVGVFPAKVALVEHNVWSAPAVATVGGVVNVISTLSLVLGQTPLEIVQRKSYVVPDTPLNTVVGLFAFTKLPPAPLTIVQVPVPVVAAFPARVAEVAHKV